MNLYSSGFLLLTRLEFLTEFVTDQFSVNTSPIATQIIVAKKDHKFIAEIRHLILQHSTF